MDRGATLIELLVVLVLVAIVAAGSSVPITQGAQIWQWTRFREDLVPQARQGLQRMTREVSTVRDDRSVVTANGTTFSFVSGLPGNETVTFQYDAGGSRLNRNGTLLISNVSSFAFTYYGMSGAALPTPKTGSAQDTDLWLVKADLTVAGGGHTLDLDQTVHPRSFLRSVK